MIIRYACAKAHKLWVNFIVYGLMSVKITKIGY